MPKEELIQPDLLYISATFMLCNRKREKLLKLGYDKQGKIEVL
jgi:hypothetical protein